MDIRKLIEKYKAERTYYLTDHYNETLLRSDFLDPLFELLGWDIKNRAGKPTNEREVILEEPLKAGASIDLSIYSEEEIESYIHGYGFSLKNNPHFINIKEECGDDWKQLCCEYIFEQLIPELLTYEQFELMNL